ncbi:FHA domain-containing protein [Eisenibacter elegans]|uniref:FHA domain-containing protein n=1 Tax=Eisenibacter elegans TaxID=997 RepID=UPI00068796AF|nr:FHA domain-containing protein [Eisenibacter elegans]
MRPTQSRIPALFVLLFWLSLGLQPYSLWAQSLTVLKVDTTNFPTLKVMVQIQDEIPPIETDLRVLDEEQNDLTFSFTAQNDSIHRADRNIFFLIEASSFTQGRAVDNFRKALVRVLDEMESKDRVNIGFFGATGNRGRALQVLSADFSTNFSLFKEEVQTKIMAPEDSNQTADVYKAMYEALEFFNKPDVNGKKMLIVLSAAINSSRSPYTSDDVIEKAQRLGIPIYTISYKTNDLYAPDNFILISDKTNGETATSKTAADIRSALGNFLEVIKAKDGYLNNYLLTFTTYQPADGNMHQFDIQYKSQSNLVTYQAPFRQKRSSSSWNDLFILALILGAVVAAYFFWRYRQQQLAGGGPMDLPEEDFFDDDDDAFDEPPRESEEMIRIQSLSQENQQLRQQLSSLTDEMQQVRSAIQQQQQPPPPPPPPVPEKFDLKKTIIAGGGGTPKLLVATTEFQHSFALNKPSLSIGRNPENDICIPERTVSGQHAVISITSGSFTISDAGSTNGTFVNGTRVQSAKLKAGDIIKLGAAQCKFQI